MKSFLRIELAAAGVLFCAIACLMAAALWQISPWGVLLLVQFIHTGCRLQAAWHEYRNNTQPPDER